MSISRRHFLLGSAAGLILPSYYDKAFSYFANHGEPLLAQPRHYWETLYACRRSDGSFALHLGDPAWQPPPMTLGEYIERSHQCAYEYVAMDLDMELEEVTDEVLEAYDWDQEVEPELSIDYVSSDAWPSTKAHDYLRDLDLGSQLESARTAGELRFISGESAANDYYGVYTGDGVTLSLLQQRLNELDVGLRVALY